MKGKIEEANRELGLEKRLFGRRVGVRGFFSVF